MKTKEFIIWCDESIKQGEFYSNFYGGMLIKNNDVDFVLKKLHKIVQDCHITEEIKWAKVDDYKLKAFYALMDIYFDLIKQNKIKVRIMFTQNANVAKGLSKEHYDNEFFLLYYQFIKHSFGLQYSNKTEEPINLRLYFDYLPDTISKVQAFKEYLKGLERTKYFKNASLLLRKENITEVDSKKHLPLQFLDVVLGAMQFRLNNKHKIKIAGTKKRGKRTIAKEKLYKHIYAKISEIRPKFNIGVSTGLNPLHKNKEEDKWKQPYRHWKFTPKNFEIDETKYK